MAGHLREALRSANEGVRIAEDTGQLHSAANLRGIIARITAMTGDADTCVALASEAIHPWRGTAFVQCRTGRARACGARLGVRAV